MSYEFRVNSIADSTKKSRLMQWDTYLKACKFYGWEPFKCSVKQACQYVSWLSSKLEYTSILAYYQAVIFFHVCKGVEPVRMADPVLKSTLAGIKRSKLDHKIGKDPIFPEHLVKVSKVVRIIDEAELLVFVAMLLMFRSLLRVSHIVKSDHTLLRSDVKFNVNGALLSINSSKTVRKGGQVFYFTPNTLQVEYTLSSKHNK